MSLYDWSVTAANNDNADSNINWGEGQPASTVNDSARAQMAAVAAFLQQINGAGTSGGTNNAYTFTSAAGNALIAYAAGNIICFKASEDNTATPPATLNVDGLGAKALKKFGSTDLVANDIESGNLILAIYDGADFQIMSPVANANVEAFSAMAGAATDTLPYFSGPSMMMATTFTAFARLFVAEADAVAMRSRLNLGSAALVGVGTDPGEVPTTADADSRYLNEASNLTDGTKATMLSTLGISNARNVTFGTTAPPALGDGEIYLRHN